MGRKLTRFYNEFYISIDKTFELCPRCDGTGQEVEFDIEGFCSAVHWIHKCRTCRGKGRVDWVKKMIGDI